MSFLRMFTKQGRAEFDAECGRATEGYNAMRAWRERVDTAPPNEERLLTAFEAWCEIDYETFVLELELSPAQIDHLVDDNEVAVQHLSPGKFEFSLLPEACEAIDLIRRHTNESR